MVANQPDVGVPLEDWVKGAQVVHPQELLTTKLDGIRHEVEHRNPNRHLNQHWQATRQWTNTILGILCHHRLLLLHLVLWLVELSGSCLELWLQHTHLGRTHIALLYHRVGDELEEQCDENQYDTHWEYIAQPVEYVECEETVDPADDRPSQINEFLELQVLAEGALLLSILQNLEVIRTEVELKLRSLLAGWVEGCLHLSLELLQVARTLLLRNRGHEGILVEVVLSYYNS